MMMQTINSDQHLPGAAPVAPPADEVLEEILEAAGLEPLHQPEPRQ